MASNLLLAVSLLALALSTLAAVPPATLSIKFGSNVGPITPTNPRGSLSSGLFAVPEAGGTPVRHSFLFKYANQVAYDVETQTLWAFDVDGTGALKVWNTSSWTEANIKDAAFNPTPLYMTSDPWVIDIRSNYIWYYHMKSKNGSWFIFGSNYEQNFIDKITPNGTSLSRTNLLSYTPPSGNDAFVVSFDESIIYLEEADPDCLGGVCLPSKISVNSFSGEANLTRLSAVQTKCPNDTWVQSMSITQDGKTLVVGCYAAAYELFNISNPLAPVSLGVFTDSGTTFQCQMEDSNMGSGAADNTAPPAWVSQVNDTYFNVDVLVSTSPRTLRTFNPKDENLWWCAATPTQKVVLIGPQYLEIYPLASNAAPSYSAKTVCDVLNWVATLHNHSLFFHTRSPQCNCEDLATKPCPVGFELVSSEGQSVIAPFLTAWGQYFVIGKDYQESLSTSETTVSLGAELTWPVEPMFFNNTVNNLLYATIQPCVNGSLVLTAADTPRFKDKWVLIGTMRLTEDCGANPRALSEYLIANGAKGLLYQLRAEDVLAYPGNSSPVPVAVVTYEMGQAILLAWNASQCHADTTCTPAAPTTPEPAGTPTPQDGAAHNSLGALVVFAALALKYFN